MKIIENGDFVELTPEEHDLTGSHLITLNGSISDPNSLKYIQDVVKKIKEGTLYDNVKEE